MLQRLWRNVVDENTGEVRVTDGDLDTKTLKLLNNTIADVTVEMEAMRPNTAIAKLIVLNNHLTSLDEVPRAAVEPLILMLSPIAPHICEELWNKLGHGESLAHAEWPKADERYVGQDTVTAVVQIKARSVPSLRFRPTSTRRNLRRWRWNPSPTVWAARNRARSSSRLRRSCPSFPRNDVSENFRN